MQQQTVGAELGKLDWGEILKGLECDAKEFGLYQQRVQARVRIINRDECKKHGREAGNYYVNTVFPGIQRELTNSAIDGKLFFKSGPEKIEVLLFSLSFFNVSKKTELEYF